MQSSQWGGNVQQQQQQQGLEGERAVFFVN
jgi:hypothetical protein